MGDATAASPLHHALGPKPPPVKAPPGHKRLGNAYVREAEAGPKFRALYRAPAQAVAADPRRGRNALPGRAPRVPQAATPSASSTDTHGTPTASATGAYVTCPPATLTPSFSPGFSLMAAATPAEARWSAYGMVALVSA